MRRLGRSLPFLVFLCNTAMASLTPQALEQEIANTTTAALNSEVWGLVAPESSETLAEARNLSEGNRGWLSLVPAQARFRDGTLVFTLSDRTTSVGAGNCGNLSAAVLHPNLGLKFDVTLEIEQSLPGKVTWTLIPWADGERTRLETIIAQREETARTGSVK